MQLCFILQNSIQMSQKATSKQISLFDQVKSSLETLLRSLFQTNIINQNNVIHLFVSSSTQPICSYEHDELHLFHQIKNLQCTFPVFPAEVIQSALNHIGKFRCLDQSQTFLGYRKGEIQDPAMLFYITGRSSQRHINKIHNLIQLNKLQLRAEYKFVAIKFGSSIVKQGQFAEEKSLMKNQSMKQYYRTNQLMKLINGCLLCAYQPASLINLVKKQIRSFVPSLRIQMQQKEYKIHNKQLIKTEIPLHVQEKYSSLIKQILHPQPSNIYPTNNQFFINCTPCIKSPLVPLPFQMTPRLDMNSQLDGVSIQKFFPIRFAIDFHKEYVGKLFSIMKLFFDKYKVQQSKPLNRVSSFMAANNIHEKKFPIFYQAKKNQPSLIGFLRLCFQSSGRAIWQMHISFSNFVNLNSHIKAYKQGQANAQQYFQNYMSSLPAMYVKFLRLYLQHFGIKISVETMQSSTNKMLQVINQKYYQHNFNQQTLLRNEFSVQKQLHQNNMSKCCSIYSNQFQDIQVKKLIYQEKDKHQMNQFVYQKLISLQNIKKQFCINDYFVAKPVKSVSIKQEVDKYKIRRDDHELDQIVGDLLGNPFKKIYKKVKIDDQAESRWIDQSQIDQMKQLLQQQTDLVQKIQYQNSDKLTKTSDKSRSIDNLYDKLVNAKQKLKKDIVISEDIINYIQVDISQKKNQNKIQIQKDKYPKRENLSEVLHSSSKKSIQLEQNNKQNQSQNLLIEDKSNLLIKDQSTLFIQDKSNLQKNLQIINEVNKSFKMNKFDLFGLPSQLVKNNLFVKNKKIIDQVIGRK